MIWVVFKINVCLRLGLIGFRVSIEVEVMVRVVVRLRVLHRVSVRIRVSC